MWTLACFYFVDKQNCDHCVISFLKMYRGSKIKYVRTYSQLQFYIENEFGDHIHVQHKKFGGFENRHPMEEQDVEHPVEFICFGKDYDEEKKETSQHQEVFKKDKQD